MVSELARGRGCAWQVLRARLCLSFFQTDVSGNETMDRVFCKVWKDWLMGIYSTEQILLLHLLHWSYAHYASGSLRES